MGEQAIFFDAVPDLQVQALPGKVTSLRGASMAPACIWCRLVPTPKASLSPSCFRYPESRMPGRAARPWRTAGHRCDDLDAVTRAKRRFHLQLIIIPGPNQPKHMNTYLDEFCMDLVNAGPTGQCTHAVLQPTSAAWQPSCASCCGLPAQPAAACLRSLLPHGCTACCRPHAAAARLQLPARPRACAPAYVAALSCRP